MMSRSGIARRRLLGAGLAAVALPAGLARAQGPHPASPAPAVPPMELVESVLGNGLQVVVLPSQRAPIVTQMLWYKVGSADEDPGQSGLAHFLEHLMFKGTPSVEPAAFSRIVSRTGGRDNAFTSYDYTGYFQTVAPEHLELVMRMEADRMANLVIIEKELLPEREVVLEERRQVVDSRPSALLSEAASLKMWGQRGYGLPISGYPEEIRKLGVAEAMAFYRRHYAPNNAALIVAGDVTPQAVFRLADRYYGGHPRRDVAARARPAAAAPDLPQRIERRDGRVRQIEVNRDYVAPSYRAGESQHAWALQILAQVLGGSEVSRLWRSLVIERQVALSIATQYSAQALGLSAFALWASQAPGRTAAEIEAALDEEIDRMLQTGPTADEVARAKARLQAATIYARDSLNSGPRRYGAAIATGGSIAEVETWPERIAAVTAEQVLMAARAVLRADRSVTSLLLPEQAKG